MGKINLGRMIFGGLVAGSDHQRGRGWRKGTPDCVSTHEATKEARHLSSWDLPGKTATDITT
jgi:hypothetical protein